MSDEIISIKDYLAVAGVDDVDVADVADVDLVLISIGGHTCWRMNGKFLFCPLTSPINPGRDRLQALVRRLRIKYHPDKRSGDDTVFCAISELLKNNGPGDDAMSVVMGMLSGHFKSMTEQDITDMKVYQLKQCVYTFMDKFHHVYRTYCDRVIGIPFVYLPGLEVRFKYIVYKFLSVIRGTITKLLVDGHMKTEVKLLIASIRSMKQDVTTLKSNVVAKLLTLTQPLNPVIISNYGVEESMTFSCAVHGLHKLLYSIVVTFKHDMVQLDAFKCRVLDVVSFDADGLTTRYVAPRITTAATPLVKQKRPKVTKMHIKTWRDKRPARIVTSLEVIMPQVCEREIRLRKSARLARLHPRRSHRLFMKK
mgnify:CR=1 FL=1